MDDNHSEVSVDEIFQKPHFQEEKGFTLTEHEIDHHVRSGDCFGVFADEPHYVRNDVRDLLRGGRALPVASAGRERATIARSGRGSSCQPPQQPNLTERFRVHGFKSRNATRSAVRGQCCQIVRLVAKRAT